MNSNEKLIQHFYTSFQQKDIKAMQDSYAANATFEDPAFGKLNAAEVKYMWEMLISSSKDMQVSFSHVQANEHSGSAEWVATYSFSATGNKVVNRVKASFIFENGKIVEHRDHFSFYIWARQALGISGLLLGWTSFLKNKVRKTATGKLKKYMVSR